ncbi:hypothetical protein WA026_021790 [Henosepilachna vigintioctopunctata]|uniref:CRAL-TRIO domain-containing protein n=1 Tax=Henosepilachna vigintioctopunctata TaxID=420089 RepID=A0AAW1TZZ8_9CUCU
MNTVVTGVTTIMQLSDLKSSRDDILKKHGKTQLSFQSDVEILRCWIEKQPHLPRDQLQDEFLEIILIKNKYSIEKSKGKIENYCTLKGLQRYRYLSEIEITVPSSEPQFYIPLPKLTDDHHRIIVLKIWDPEKWEIKGDVASGFVIREILARFDYNDGEIFIFDWSECTPAILSKLRVNILIDVVNIVFKAYSARIKKIHLINKIASTFFNWAKPFLPSKLVSRVQLHENISTVAEILPAKCLPKDYGGELKTLHEFIKDFDSIYAEHMEDLLQYVDTKSREEKRQGGSIMDEMQGTFKKLEID